MLGARCKLKQGLTPFYCKATTQKPIYNNIQIYMLNYSDTCSFYCSFYQVSQMVLSDCMRAQHTQRASEEFGLTPPGAYPVCGAIYTLHRVSVENMSQQLRCAHIQISVHTRKLVYLSVYKHTQLLKGRSNSQLSNDVIKTVDH